MPKRRDSWTIGQFADLYQKEEEVDRAKRNLYVKICKLFLSKLARELLKGKAIKLPTLLGVFMIKKTLTRHRPINWKETTIHKKVIKHLNLHTDGYCYRLKWYKDIGYGMLKNGELYSFVPVERFRALISKTIKENPNIPFHER